MCFRSCAGALLGRPPTGTPSCCILASDAPLHLHWRTPGLATRRLQLTHCLAQQRPSALTLARFLNSHLQTNPHALLWCPLGRQGMSKCKSELEPNWLFGGILRLTSNTAATA